MPETLIPPVAAKSATPIELVFEEAWPDRAPDPARAFAELQDFRGQAGRLVLIADAAGAVARVLFGLGKRAEADAMVLRQLPSRLPPGDYALETPPAALRPDLAALAWSLGGYGFDRYKPRSERARPRLALPEGVDLEAVRATAHACALARDMVNTPASDMGPLQIETIAREIAEAFGARLTVTQGAELEAGYPAVHAVGRAAAPHRGPRLLELGWNEARTDLPMVALVGKGVVFDTGGLDLKPSSGMRLMKKDMGGAAHALALGRMVMQANLPVRLIVLCPVVENAVSGDAFRPGDVLNSRKGLTIEIGNTDAEGRLILADALTRAGEFTPDLTLDFATLTGAARVALGPELPPVFTDDDALAAELMAASAAESDPMWRMPLWRGYRDAVDGEVGQVRNDPADWAQAGSVTAALFLQRFAPSSGAWAHFDVYAWNPRARPGWPVGGEAQAIRAVFKVLKMRFC
jgi:leucyl aminopeptidase